MSYIRYYKEHRANYIFNFKNLDPQELARLFGLSELPLMRELNNIPEKYGEGKNGRQSKKIKQKHKRQRPE